MKTIYFIRTVTAVIFVWSLMQIIGVSYGESRLFLFDHEVTFYKPLVIVMNSAIALMSAGAFLFLEQKER